MKLPDWAPPELVEMRRWLKVKIKEDLERSHEFSEEHPPVDWRLRLESEDRRWMRDTSPSSKSLLQLLEPLLTNPSMRSVWKNLQRRTGDFENVRLGIYSASSPCGNLVGACFQAEHRWINLPKWTRTEFKRIHQEIAARALQLCELLAQVNRSSSILDLREYIEDEKLSDFLARLEEDGQNSRGLDWYIEDHIGDALPSIPKVLLELHKRATDQAKRPYGVSQPNSPNAKLNFYIHRLSMYFQKAYGQPLNGYVAGIVSAIFDEDVDEDRVRALLRTRRQA